MNRKSQKTVWPLCWKPSAQSARQGEGNSHVDLVVPKRPELGIEGSSQWLAVTFVVPILLSLLDIRGGELDKLLQGSSIGGRNCGYSRARATRPGVLSFGGR
jgi:hypothetical protein